MLLLLCTLNVVKEAIKPDYLDHMQQQNMVIINSVTLILLILCTTLIIEVNVEIIL